MTLASLAVLQAAVLNEVLVTNAIDLIEFRHFNWELFPACLPSRQQLWSPGFPLKSDAKLPRKQCRNVSGQVTRDEDFEESP